MNKILTRFAGHALWTLLTIAYISLGLEIFLFQARNYNVYRVLDISFSDFLLILLVLTVQYFLLRKVLGHLTNLWEMSWQQKSLRYFLLLTIFLGVGIYSLLHSLFPFWIFFIILADLLALWVLNKQFGRNLLQRTILLLLFGAGLNASLVFWLHEETNENRHIHFAKALAERRDTIAEKQILALAAMDLDRAEGGAVKSFWEKKWINNSYLSSNYRFGFHPVDPDSTANVYQPILRIDEENNPVYWMFFPENYALSFEFNKDFRQSVYTPNQPYKNLDRLYDYHFAVVDHSEIVLANSHDFDQIIFDIELPPVGTGKKIESKNYDVLAYHHADQKYVLIGEPLSEVQVWISNFAFFFSLLLLVALFVEALNLIWTQKDIREYWKKRPIQSRIQFTLFGVTLLSFFIIAATTFLFLRENNLETSYERQQYITGTLRKVIGKDQKYSQQNIKNLEVNELADLADRKQCDIDFYDLQGNLLISSIASAQNSPAPALIRPEIKEEIRKNPVSIIVREFEKDNKPYLRTYFGLLDGKEIQGFGAINSFESEIGTAQDIPIIMSKLLNVYVFLLLITWGGGLLLINMLTKPLVLLASLLSKFKLGKQNEKLQWEGEDTIGRLIGEYNKMVDQVEQTTRELVRSEREGAWQIMAQQVAHEINNSLTPLRLNIQYLTRVMQSEDFSNSDAVKSITSGLLEKIDHLSHVASQFKIFAKLENPQAKPVELKSFLKQFDADYQWQVDHQLSFNGSAQNGINPIVEIDTQHLQHVLKNLVSNAEYAVSEEENGAVQLRLKVEQGKAIVEVEDNGHLLEADEIEKIFDPQFSTNSAHLGLGLPVCLRIVELYEGELSLVSKFGEGNCFQISLPLMKN